MGPDDHYTKTVELNWFIDLNFQRWSYFVKVSITNIQTSVMIALFVGNMFDIQMVCELAARCFDKDLIKIP